MITEGQPETQVQFELARPSGEKYMLEVQRDLMIPITDVTEDLYSPGLYLSSEGNKIYVDKNGVVPLSSAAEAGVLEYYILESIDNFRVSGKPLSELMPKINEMLIGPEDSPITMVFKTSAGMMRYSLKRDVPMKMGKVTANKAQQAISNRKLGAAFPFEEDNLRPGQGVPLHPMCNPKLWASLKEGAELANKQFELMSSQGMNAGSPNHFMWRQRMVNRTGDMPGVMVREGMYRVDEVSFGASGTGPEERSLLYYGPGPTDTDEQEEERKRQEAEKAARAQQAEADAAAKREEDEKRKQKAAEDAKREAAKSADIAKDQKQSQRSSPPPPPQPPNRDPTPPSRTPCDA